MSLFAGETPVLGPFSVVAPDNTTVGSISNAGSWSIGSTLKTSQNLVRGRLKLDVRPTGGTTEDYALQIRSVSAKTSGTHWGIDSETHLGASGTTSVRGVQGVAVLDSTFTSTAGTLVGSYGQVRADGTFNAAGGFMAGVYGLVEASAAITASHVASAWFDSHQANAVTGSHELVYMTNNGAATLDQGFYIYGGMGALMALDTVGAAFAATGTAANGTVGKIKILVDGTPYYINAYQTSNN